MFWAKVRLFWSRWWIPFVLGLAIAISILIPLWYLSGMEESVRRYIIAINVASLPFQTYATLLFVAFLYLMQFGGGFAMFRKSKIDSEKVNIRFADVIGNDEAKREAIEVVELLKDRARVKRVGGKILRGLLMVGPPGCGKTMLAKAIATEAGVPFLATSGSEFIEIFVGVGASRVRKLFSQARDYARAYGACIIFIDEIEVLGRTRVVYDAFGGGQEGNATLNQLLVEMDGLTDSDAPVVVIGAMNMKEEVLDPALRRPGRFDRQITIDLPNLKERQDVFAYYAKKIKVDPTLDFARLARKAIRYSPAEIENVLKEAILIATREKRESVTYKDCTRAIERIELGIAHRVMMTHKEREMTAFHEAGHLVLVYLNHPTNDVFKASIIQRGGVLGVVHSIPREEYILSDSASLYADLLVSLGGYTAEKIKYGVTTEGVGSDFSHAMSRAHYMVWVIGMGESGLVGNYHSLPDKALSDNMKDRLMNDTNALLNKALKQADGILRAEWRIVERFASELLKREELDYDEIVEIFREYGKQPHPLPESDAASVAAVLPPVAPAPPPQLPGNA
jgi:cell division protease FtsH